MNISEFFQSVGDWFYGIWQAANGWIQWLWGSVSKWIADLFPANAIKFFSNDKMNRYLFFGVMLFILVMNIWAFALFGADKASAKKKKHRVKESRLFGVCFWGGAIGGMMGMYLFRHKTLKKRFAVGVPVLFILQLIADSFVLGFLGFWTFF